MKAINFFMLSAIIVLQFQVCLCEITNELVACSNIQHDCQNGGKCWESTLYKYIICEYHST
jgi:hypothetical protein